MKLKIVYFLLVVFAISCKKDSVSPGSSVANNDYLASKNYEKLVIEIQTVSGNNLDPATVNNLISFLQARLNKPAGIQVVQNNVSSSGKTMMTLDEIKNFEAANRTQHNSGKTLSAYILVLDAAYSENAGSSKVLGVAYSTSSMALFEKTIKSFSGGLGQPSVTTLETTVLNHEFGHILGLVNNGSAMVSDHQDKPHGRHCTNTNCLMYYAAETSDIIANLLGNNIPSLDENCLNDLKANGGK